MNPNALNTQLPAIRIGDRDFSRVYRVRYEHPRWGATSKYFWGRDLNAAMNCAVLNEGTVDVTRYSKSIYIQAA